MSQGLVRGSGRRVIQALGDPPEPLCDDCLAVEGGWSSRQGARAVALRLTAKGIIERRIDLCSHCRRTKTVSVPSSPSAAILVPRQPRPISGAIAAAPDCARMAAVLRGWIVEVVDAHPAIADLACRQRAKFEGWLKFELAQRMTEAGAGSVEVESGYESGQRCDLSFEYEGRPYAVEIKTANTNYRLPGAVAVTRPVTKNIAGIAEDARKLQGFGCPGLVAFILFPIPAGDHRWEEYFWRIAGELDGIAGPEEYCSAHPIRLAGGDRCEIVVGVLPVG